MSTIELPIIAAKKYTENISLRITPEMKAAMARLKMAQVDVSELIRRILDDGITKATERLDETESEGA